MQRNSQRHIYIFFQLIDFRHHARSAQSDTALRNAVTEIFFHHFHGANYVVVVQQGLAHAHHYHVSNGMLPKILPRTERFARQPHLANNFSSIKIALKALFTSGTEAAINCTAHLRRHTQSAAATIWYKHHFHGATTIYF